MWERETSQGTGLQGLWMLLVEGVAKKGHYKKVCLQGKHSAHHSLETTTDELWQGLGPVNPYISMMRDNQFTLTWLVFPMANKHLIRFPIAIEPMTLRSKGTHADSSLSTPSVLLKADTGADVNLMINS